MATSAVVALAPGVVPGWGEGAEAAPPTRPGLLVTPAGLGQLRERSHLQPWADILAASVRVCQDATYPASRDAGHTDDPADVIEVASHELRDLVGACTVVAVAHRDPSRAAEARARAVAGLQEWPTHLEQTRAAQVARGWRWDVVVPVSSAFFTSVLALDLLHPSLSLEDRLLLEAALDDVADYFWSVPSRATWGTATHGARAVWAVYTGDTSRSAAIGAYRSAYLGWLTSDGVFKEGPAYGIARYGGTRTAKSGFAHVAEFTGVDRSYYGSRRVQRLHEWLLGGAFGPSGAGATLGDSGAGRLLTAVGPDLGAAASVQHDPGMPWWAGRFGPRAGALAAWRWQRGHVLDPPADLLTYLVARPLAAPAAPASESWANGGASLWAPPDPALDEPEDEAQWVALGNSSGQDGHKHRDVNALHLEAAGHLALANSGYGRYGSGAPGMSWADIHHLAASQNVLEVGPARTDTSHTDGSRAGDGVGLHLSAAGLELVQGRASGALPDHEGYGDSTHLRDVLQVPGEDGRRPYVVVVDEVTGVPPHTELRLRWRPPSQAVSGNGDTGLRWTLSADGRRDATLQLYLGTVPRNARDASEGGPLLVEGASARSASDSLLGSHVRAVYRTGGHGLDRLATVLLVRDAERPGPGWSRVVGEGWRDARVHHADGTTDHVVTTAFPRAAGGPVVVAGASLHAAVAWWRPGGAGARGYAVRDGRTLRVGSKGVVGFTAEGVVSVAMRGGVGTVFNPGAEPVRVTWRHPGTQGGSLETGSVVASSTPGQVTLVVPPGRHSVRLRGVS